MKTVIKSIAAVFFLAQSILFSSAQTTERPMIWVKPSDKAVILEKIKNNKWAKEYFEAFKKRLDEDILAHQKNPEEYLSKMPFDWSVKTDKLPPFQTVRAEQYNTDLRIWTMKYLKVGVDAGIVYFLTEDPKYGQIGADILYAMIEGLSQLKPSGKGHNGGGLLYPDDHLREAREIGAQLPILYDFIYPFLQKGGKPFALHTKQKADFSYELAEQVFKTYINLALEVGIINCNWPVLESSSLVGNTLALDNEQERKKFLEYYLTKNTPNQDALLKVANHYKDNNGKWPESTNYSGAVASLSTYLMTLLTKIYPELHLGLAYPQIPLALTTNYYLTYPNKTDMIIFGDGHRKYHAAYEEFEIAYYLGQLENSEILKKEFGALLNSGISNKSYTRGELKDRNNGAEVYTQPLELLWFSPIIKGELKDYPLPTTDELAFAGMALQRNLSPTGNPKDALMTFAAGGSHVHGHASGMNMELYGKGYVLGQKGGRSTYTTDIHENYYRIFAGHNTVIVNGSSESAGGWANLGTNTVKLEAVEPAIKARPISTNHSFTTTSFVDNKGDKAEAIQERTLGIVRTSPTSGYYIDVFRSKSSLPNEYHDYIYHNIGEKLDIQAGDKAFKPDEERYAAYAKIEWTNNKKHRHPGWHFFKEVKTLENYPEPVTAEFTAAKLKQEPVKMKLFINANIGRNYTSVMAPPSTESYKPYEKKPTPTLVIRQSGEAWRVPFAVVYEPTEGNESTVQSVEQLLVNSEFKGLKIKSKIKGQVLTQYAIILENENAIFEDKKLGIKFQGRYAMLTLENENKLHSAYMGDGKLLSYKNLDISSLNNKSGAAHIDFSEKDIKSNNSDNISIKYK